VYRPIGWKVDGLVLSRTCFLPLVWNETVWAELRPVTGPLSVPSEHKSSGGMILAEENERIRRKTCLSVILSTTNSTRTGLGTNPSLCGENQATNGLSKGTASERLNLSVMTPYISLYGQMQVVKERGFIAVIHTVGYINILMETCYLMPVIENITLH
jgi:hypothetical protein